MKGLSFKFNDIPAGILTGLLITLLSISYSTLIFKQGLAGYLPVGIGLSISVTIILTLFSIFMSSLPVSVSMTQDAPAIIYGLIASHILLTVKEPTLAFDISLATFAIYTVLIGATLFILGKLRISRVIKYIPYSVIGGFLAGTGALIVYGGLASMYGESITLDNMEDFFALSKLYYWLPGFLLGAALLYLERMVRKPALIPVTFIIFCLLFYLGLYVSHISIFNAQQMGLLLGPFSSQKLWSPISLNAFANLLWHEVFNNIGYLLSLMILVPIAMLLNVTGVETTARENADLNQELKHTGLGNVVASFLGGGLIGYSSLSGSILNIQLNAKSRVSSILCVAVCLSVLIFGTGLLNYVPKFALGALVSYVGLNLVFDWLVVKRRNMPIIDYIVILSIFLVICFESFLTGVVVGLFIHLVIFVFRYSRINAMSNTFDGTEIRSHVHRSLDTVNFLGQHGSEVYTVILKGYLFFGNIDSLENNIFKQVEKLKNQVRYIVIDFARVVGIDLTSLISLEKLKIFLQQHQIKLVCSVRNENIKNKLRVIFNFTDDKDNLFYHFDTLDQCLEWTEVQQMLFHNYPIHETLSVEQAMLGVLEQHHNEIIDLPEYFQSLKLSPGDILFKQGDKCQELFFVESGCIEVYIESEKEAITISKIMGGAFVGVFAFYLGNDRTASVVATDETQLKVLTRENYKLMKERHPYLAIGLLSLLTINLSKYLIDADASMKKFLQD